MTYRVFWSPGAERRLERILKTSLQPESVVAAAKEIDQELAGDPLDFGESRYENARIGFVRPLGVHFEVLEDVRTVTVFDVWRINPS